MKFSKKLKKIGAVIAVIALVATLMPIWLFSGVEQKAVKAAEGEFILGNTATTVAKGDKYYIDFSEMTPIPNTHSAGLFSFNAGSWNGASYNGTTHGIQFKSGNRLSFKVAGNSKIVVGGNNNNDCDNMVATSATGTFDVTTQSTVKAARPTLDQIKAGEGDNVIVYNYTGTAGYVTLTLDPEANAGHCAYITYIAVISTEEPEGPTPYVKEVDPEIITTTGTAANLTVETQGQKIILSSTKGTASGTDANVNSDVSVYGFPATDKFYKLELDLTMTACGGSNCGVFVGAFGPGNLVTTVGTRNSLSAPNLRGVYSKGTFGAGGPNTNLTEAEKVHYSVEKTGDGLKITYTPYKTTDAIGSYTFPFGSASYKQFEANGASTVVNYGIMVANATGVVSNMKYYNEAGKLIYDQNKELVAVGTAPVVSSVSGAANSTRDAINISWESSTEIAGDGVYVLEVSKDGGDWSLVSDEVLEKTYSYALPSGAAGDFKFRVSGKLGEDVNTPVESSTVTVIASLTAPTLTTAVSDGKINVSWAAIGGVSNYKLYRYSFDEGKANATKIYEGTETSYADADVVVDMPYYYYATAHSADNYSNNSAEVWTIVASDRTSGAYAYESDAANITITEKSNDTVSDGKATIKGSVDKEGTIKLVVNGKKADEATVSEGGTFSFENIELEAGRNGVDLLFTDSSNKVTRKTYNFVTLTRYDYIVDSKFEGTDGTKDSEGIPQYKTVKAAYDSIADDNSETKVIFVKNGDYEERLDIKKANVSIIGEDADKTVIHCYPGDSKWGLASGERGGNTADRCAMYVEKTATNFTAENVSIKNDWDYKGNTGISNESAEALRTDANNALYTNVKLYSFQDTLLANTNKATFTKCYIIGNVDFMWGQESQALFDDCQIVFRYAPGKNSGYVTALKSAKTQEYGWIYNNCSFTSEDGCSGTKYYLGRPYGEYAAVAMINCYVGSVFNLEGYTNWGGALLSTDATALDHSRYYEYGTYGPGYALKVSRKQMSKNKADEMLSAYKNDTKYDEHLKELSDLYVKVGEVIAEPAVEEGAPEMEIASSKEELEDAILTAEEKEAVKKGASIKITVSEKKVELTKEDKAAVDKLDIKNLVLGEAVDISIIKIVGGVEKNVTSTSKAIKLQVKIPESMINTDPSIKRTYYIIRIHDGVAEKLETTESEGDLTFASDKYSTYVIAYVDSKADTAEAAPATTPSTTVGTGDTSNMKLYIIIAILALVVGGAAVVVSKKAKR